MRRCSPFLAALGLLALIITTPIIASTTTGATYKGGVNAINVSYASAHNSVPFTLNTQALIDALYLDSDCANAALTNASGTDIPFMPAPGSGTNWIVFVDDIQQNATISYLLYTGGADMGGAIRYFPSDTGMTIADAASLELGNDFILEADGFYDTSSGTRNIVYKPGACRLYVSAANTIEFEILNGGDGSAAPYSTTGDGQVSATGTNYYTQQTAATGTVSSAATSITIGQSYTVATTVASVYRGFFYFDTTAIPDTATILSGTLQLWGVTDGSTDSEFDLVIQNGQPTYPASPLAAADYNKAYYTGDGGSINTAAYSTGAYNTITLNDTGLGWIDVDGTTKLCIRSSRDISGTMPSGLGSTYTETVTVAAADTGGAGNDPLLTVYYDDSGVTKSVTLAAITPGEYNVKVTADGTDLKIFKNDVEGDTVALAGASIPDRSTAWAAFVDYSMPYVEYAKITVSDVLKGHWYWQNAVTFTDQSGNSNTATPSFRTISTDSDVSASVVSFAPYAPSVGGVTTTSASAGPITTLPADPVVTDVAPSNMTNIPFIGTPISDYFVDNDIPEGLFTYPFMMIMLALVVFVVFHFTRDIGWAGIAQFVISGLFIAWRLLPWPALFFFGIVLVFTIVKRRTINI